MSTTSPGLFDGDASETRVTASARDRRLAVSRFMSSSARGSLGPREYQHSIGLAKPSRYFSRSSPASAAASFRYASCASPRAEGADAGVTTVVTVEVDVDVDMDGGSDG